MTTEEQIQKIEALLLELLAPEPEYFLIQVRIKPTNNIKVFIDGDNGVTIDKCVRINRQLYKKIEEAGFYPEGEFSLEVSSAGVGEPLKMLRQYTRNIDRFVEVSFNDGTVKEGKLIQVADSDIIIEETTGKGKKAVTQQVVIPFENIKTTTVQIKF
ncbi:ribosome maturation factor RimP [Filimonas zeae]|uniref:Ribosome maturation factor RimP n=1 Tax=Filimonas zeae TaxID=1737353 RepID=A0A917MYD3_9BACT|nr:ribosome assembly cofactor RimP [Filimonas zeae]MDR6340950.1 ribosome maturation factor RimP [Filimonas zeae]GGH77822.1 ribosome maturation factor RimP [Filimonas zeae]